MMCGYMHGASIVTGYTLLKEDKSLLNAFEQYDNLIYNASFLGFAIMGNPYTASGRNLSYRRDFFFKRGAFISHYTIPEGADDLFVNQNANRSNTAIVLDPKAAVVTDAKNTFSMWHLDRMHRYATRRYYPFKDKLMLSLYPLSQALFLASLLILWICGLFPWQLLLALLVVKLIWQIVSCSFLVKRFEIKKIQFFSPFFELYFLFANTILFLLTLRKKHIKWR